MTEGVQLVFETHSLTTDNEQGVATGWLGGRLSDRGRPLATELGARRRDDGIDLVISSDLARAVETARIAFAATTLPVVLDWRLRELDYGDLNGGPVDAVARERAARRGAVPGGRELPRRRRTRRRAARRGARRAPRAADPPDRAHRDPLGARPPSTVRRSRTSSASRSSGARAGSTCSGRTPAAGASP